MSIFQLRIIKLLLLLLLITPPTQCIANDCVILLHGMGRSHNAMYQLEQQLSQHNYNVVNRDYPSTTKSIADIANNDIPKMISLCGEHPKQIHFVTHSLGGIVLRQYLATHKNVSIGRVVMLSPPNHGSPLADLLHNNILFKKLTGPAGQALTTSSSSIPNSLPDASQYSVGIIAGSFSPTGYLFFNESNDGKVAVNSARLTGMTDFIVLPVSHTFMMNKAIVAKQVIAFLHSGKFIRQLHV